MKPIYRYSLIFAAAVAGLTSCSNEELVSKVGDSEGKTIHLTVNATKEAFIDAETRSSLLENDKGGLDFDWTANDRIIVAIDGKIKGSLTLVGQEGNGEGQFEGDLQGVQGTDVTLHCYYLGTANNAVEVADLVPYSHSYATPRGTADSMDDYDIMTTSAKMNLVGYDYTLNMQFHRRVSNAKFELRFPDGVEYPVTVTLSGTELNNKVNLSYDRSDKDCVTVEKGDITVTVAEPREANGAVSDIYVTHLQTDAAYELNFMAVDNNGKTFTGMYNISRKVGQNEYFRKKYGEGDNVTFGGLPVEFTEVVETPDYDIIFKTYPEGTENNPVYDFEENLSDPSSVPLPGDPTDGESHKEFKGWKIEGSDDEPTQNPWDLTAEGKGPVVTLVPVYGDWIWTIEWRSGYGDNALVEKQGQTTYTNAESGNQARVQTPYGQGGSTYNPVREGFTFNRWVNGDKEATKTAPQTQWIRFYENQWTHVWTAEWNRQYEIVYHFDSADPDHSNSNTENNTSYNAMVIDRPTGVENGYNYTIIAPTSTRFDNQGKVAMTNAAGGKFLGWKKCVDCADDYDATVADRLLNGGDTWTFEGGKWRLHLEPVYEEVVPDPVTVTTPGYRPGQFN